MNKVFRIVRRKCDGRLVVASELAKSAVKGLGSTMALLSSLVAMPALATVVTAAGANSPVITKDVSTNRIISTASSSAPTTSAVLSSPVVQIRTPSTDGISHNTYSQFDVSTTGLMLNNAVTNTAAVLGAQSTGAGQVQFVIGANPQLSGGAASVILNEVVSANASTLAGSIEVVGTQADVIIANPYGITCTGCSTLNAGLTALVTGSAAVTDSTIAFDLSSEALTVANNGNGDARLDADKLALVSREIKIQSGVSGSAIDVLAHNGTATLNTSNDSWSTSATGAESDAEPSFAIDSSALGGMYANTIKLTATEGGVGVRALGDMIALGGEITITADGQLEMGSASEEVAVQARTISMDIEDDIALNQVSHN